MRLAGAAAALGVAVAGLGCASTGVVEAQYRPSANVLEVVAVLRTHVPDDTYRFEPATDFTGRNVYRSSLLRLESLERVHEDALRAGHMDGALAFAKARALERLRTYDLAEGQYRLAAERDEALRDEALHSAHVCDRLREAAEMKLEYGRGWAADADADGVLALHAERIAQLEELVREVEGTHHAYVTREEIERADVERAEYFESMRKVLPDGDVRAVSERQRVILLHKQSKNLNRWMIDLADLYAELAEEYVDDHPPESIAFDPVRFQELIDAASRLYEMVAGQDGTTEKLQASRRLEAFLAFALSVDRDRFTP